jgi:hypothetical protein
MTLSTVADAGGRGGDRGDNHDRNGHRNSIEFWKKHGSDHENGCAIGNDPPPGANCTDRYDQQ